jgi:hypothetical protein
MNFFKTKPGSLLPDLPIATEAEACAAVLMACIRANELDQNAENAAFLTSINSRNVFKGQDPAVLIQIAGKLYEMAEGPAALIDAALGHIREQTRLPLFFQCLDVILADGLVTPQEHKVFEYLKGRFRVEEELADAGLEVLVLKNQL